jgi:cation diffusion facilitator CzcD-associated flavoprotein CzcO
MRAKFVSMANGYQAKPKLPGIAGIDSFRGHTFHTSRWDYDYTGGQLENLRDKRVGIIGTGATAVQCVPHLGAAAERLYVFQRTPSSVDIRANGPTDPLWANTLQPGWQRKRIDNFQILTSGGQAEEDLVADAWTSITRKLPVMRHDTDATVSPEQRTRDIELADFGKMEEIRARVDELVTDPATAEALKPWYGYFCKRPCFHDDYLQTFNRENVTLVDTHGRGVEQITEAGVVVDGMTYELDCLIFATGFEVGTDYCRRTGFELIGRGGVTLTQRWSDGVRTFQGLCAHGFPNCLIQSIAQAGLTVNFPYLLDIQATHTAWIIAWALEHDVGEVEASAAAEAAWVETVVQRSAATAERAKTCTPGYYNREGKADAKTRQGSFFFGGPTEYADLLAAWRANADLAGLDVRPARDNP